MIPRMITLLLALTLSQDFTDKPDLDAALAKAAKENQRVLVVWGKNDDDTAKAFAALLKKDRTVAKKILYEYDLVLADAANAGLAKKLEVDLGTLPALTILAADGKKLTHEAAPAEGKPLVALLEKHQAPPWNAKELYDAALKRAKEEKKMVFLTFGAPW